MANGGDGQVCAICYYVVAENGGGEPRRAETTINGQAVCADHMDYVQGGSFAVALNLVRAHEVGRRRDSD